MNFKFDPNYIHWFDGMPLSCHHFQQSDIRYHNVANYLYSTFAPYSHGLINLEIDSPAISRAIVRLTSIECIMPDYSLVFLPIYDESPVEIDLNIHADNEQEQFIYCVSTSDHSLHEVDEVKNRYRSLQGNAVPDMNTGDNHEKIIRLSPIIHLSSQKPPANFLSIPILKFTFRNRNLKILPYDPPSPNFLLARHSKDAVDAVLTELYARLQEAYTQLKLKNNPQDFMSYGYLISREIWPLQALISSACPNPFQVYLSLARLCGMLTTIVDDVVPKFDCKYDHLNIFDSFIELVEFIKQKINSIKRLYCIDLRKFSFDSNKSRFAIEIPDKESSNLRIMLQFRIEHDFTKWIKNAIMTSDNTFESAKLDRVLGCARQIVDSSRVVDNLRTVILQIGLSQTYVKSKVLCIGNHINSDMCPIAIYLLDD